ncbi:MAG: carboxypeptidase-like regulatory domain-containing protein [Acidobacteriia bacterium]|nr:carboxypeptidase-like regulatory domain-containing protein [Terriglobia bacterium]
MIKQTKSESIGAYVSRRNVKPVSIAFSLILFAAAVSYAQTPAASISGIVGDPSGAVVAGVKVTVTDTARGVPFVTQTNSSGAYFIKDLIPSTYRITAEAAGFRTYVLQSFPLTAQQHAILNIDLQLGTASQTVEVRGQVQMVEPSNATLGGLMQNKQIVDLPLSNRNVLTLMVLQPGVVPSLPNNYTSTYFTTAVRYSINGGLESTSDFQLDGVSILAGSDVPGITALSLLPSVESVEEFRVQTNNYSAAYGRSGGGITSMVSKSGSNTFHGSGFEFLQNNALNSNGFFANRSGAKIPPVHIDQYGGSIGGPVIKNKTFFFLAHERLLSHAGGFSLLTVPTALERQGDFSQNYNSSGQLKVLYNPFSTRPDPDNPGKFIRDPIPGNNLNNLAPLGISMSSVAQKAITYYPMPNLPGTAIPGTSLYRPTNNYGASGVVASPQVQLNFRVDHNFGTNDRLFVRYGYLGNTIGGINWYGAGSKAGNWSGDLFVHVNNAVLGYTHTFGTSTVLDLRAKANRFVGYRPGQAYPFDMTSLGLPSAVADYTAQGGVPQFPGFRPSGYNYIGSSGGNYYTTYMTDWVFQGTLSRMVGRHTLTMGAENRNFMINFAQIRGFISTYTATMTQGPNPRTVSSRAGDSIASFLLGTPDVGSINYTAKTANANHYFAQFIQDDVKWTRKFTMNFGFRLEEETATTERYNRMAAMDPLVLNPISSQVTNPFTGAAGWNLYGGYVFAGSGPGTLGRRTIRGVEWKPNPRIGLAYALNDKTVIRAAYGIFFSVPYDGATTNFTSGAFSTISQMLATLDGITPYRTLDNPFPTPDSFTYPPGSSQGLLTAIGTYLQSAWPQAIGTPYNQQWNFSIQRSVTPSTLLQAAYVGNKGTHVGYWVPMLGQLTPAVQSEGATLLQLVPNPLAGLIPAGGIMNQPTVQLGWLKSPYPLWPQGAIPLEAPWGNSNYNALQVMLQKRYTGGTTFTAGYTWSKIIADTADGIWSDNLQAGVVQRSVYCRRCERAVSSYDFPHRFTFSAVGELPFGRGKRWGSKMPGVLDQFVGGWQTNAILTLASGPPLVFNTAVNNSYSFGGQQHPDYTGVNARMGKEQSLDEWFDTAQFSQPADFTFGTLGRTFTDVRSDWTRNLDFSLFKNFSITEKLRLQFRAETFNLTNTPVFAAPGTTVGTGSFGIVSSQSNSPRVVQLALKFTF